MTDRVFPEYTFPRDVTLSGTRETAALDQYYSPLRFSKVHILTLNALQLDAPDGELIRFLFVVRGKFEDLVRHRFAHPSWASLPPGGTGSHRTERFGRAIVKKFGDGDYGLKSAEYRHGLDLVAPVILPLYWTPPPRIRT
jgi:hypothetical protein